MLKSNLFKEYPNDYFIETGSYLGDGIRAALDAGFPNIVSIELSERYHAMVESRFKNEPRVTLILGDSGKELGKLLGMIREPVTIWLDGHWSGGETAMGDDISPLMRELEQIRESGKKDCTILIDDMRCWVNKEVYGFDKQAILDALHSINENYNISYRDGADGDGKVFKNDICIATP